MENERKVFSSSIIRTQNNVKNNLYDILNVDPALPVKDNQLKSLQTSDCNFKPKNDKYYVSKKKHGTKVKTVREIRAVLESDVYSYLSDDLEKQKNLLLRKIRHGSCRDEQTKETAKNMLKSCNPISKTAWQMLMNINPHGYKFSSQYVFWNGIQIQVNGSKGGSRKFLYKYDISKSNEETILNRAISKKSYINKKKGLLNNSLNVKFKPGPLTKKKNLDTSYQKYQFGEIQLVALPKLGLDISPSYGKPLAPSINSFLHKTFVSEANGVISSEWADFAVSMLGVKKNGSVVQLEENCNVTFNLNYKCSQNRILMRNDSDFINKAITNNATADIVQEPDETVLMSEVATVINKIIDSVEISLTQNELYFGEDEPRIENTLEKTENSNSLIKDKGKRKFCGELSRLDVTVIRIPELSGSVSKNTCSNDFCTLGCICNSLKSSYNLKTHCGRIDCMFECKCDFAKYKLSDSFGNDSADIIRGLVNLDKTLEETLAKEEHKFHQTVVVTDEKSILLNSRKRNWKTSTKYADFYSEMPFKSKRDIKRNASVVCTNLKIKNVEPWCMVHNMYKCFCKGKFTETTLTPDKNVNINNKVSEKCSKTCENKDSIVETKAMSPEVQYVSADDDDESLSYYKNVKYSERTLPYKGRKYNDEYYRSTHEKISEMERNDKSLRNKLMSILNKDECQENYLLEKSCTPDITCSDELHVNDVEKISGDHQIKQMSSQKLVTWLETNYKKYRAQTNFGQKQPSLHPPQPGNMALYPWDFILCRYREKKNHFLISKQQPYRIFMAVDHKHPMFVDCMNINDIALSDLDKYPVTVKNLLTNATDLKDNFCILCGMLHCWELVGSVTKVNSDKGAIKRNNERDNNTTLNNSGSGTDLECSTIFSDNSCDSLHNTPNKVVTNNNEHSKWFLMTIEKDFTEIQFYKRGFFVKYESIMKAINVAKVSGKTVKLSPQNSSNRPNNSTFGIYAVPSDKENYVFIGPYEKDESLGIETIKSNLDTKGTKRTRGTWITTNKIDNSNVINNPLLYMPSEPKTNTDKLLERKNVSASSYEINDQQLINKKDINTSLQKAGKDFSAKIVKPITIRKTNGFYQLAPNGLLKQVPINQKVVLTNSPSISLLIKNDPTSQNMPSMVSQSKEKRVSSSSVKNDQETASQMDRFNVDSTSGQINKKKEKRDGGMFILKPEEINNKSLQNLNQNSNNKDEIEMDIENFLNTFVKCPSPHNGCYIISDDEDNTNDISENKSNLKMVWIVLKNIENFGWISGMKNKDNDLSFEFPGFKYSNFYKENEAFEKLTTVLTKKLNVPKNIKIEWEVRDSEPDKSIKKITLRDLSTEYVLTKSGLRYEKESINKLKLCESAKKLEDSGDESSSVEEDILKENKSN